MGLTTSLYTALSGLSANSQAINVTGNNIANVNTTAFKASRAQFETQISQTLSTATGPNSALGGTNEVQIGLGTRVGAVTRNLNDGSIQPTGVNTDIAIEGDGFFAINVNNESRYTRAGSFNLNSNFNLVNPDGGLLQGFGIDDQFNIVDGILEDISIPVGSLSLAQATESVRFAGNLNAAGDVATVGSINTADVIFSDAAATVPALATDALTSLFDSTGTTLFSTGDIISVSGVTKGGATVPDHTFEVGPTNTTASDDFGTGLQDFLDFMEDILGIDTSVVGGGVTVAGGAITITGNTGTVNDITIAPGNIVTNPSTTPSLPFNFTKTQDADGESVRTTFIAFDSLGTALTLDLRIVLESTDNTGSTWRFFAQSETDTDLDTVLGNGLLRFDTDGQLFSTNTNTFSVNRDNTGATTPQDITFDFNSTEGTISALADVTSQVSAIDQDGAPLGTLDDFSISSDGAIVGVFTNGLERNLGRVALATFVNPQGLAEIGANLFNTTSNSGNASIVTPTTNSSGRVIGGALELSNVDLSEEFINLITASTGFSANSRVLTTSDRLIQDLLSTVR